MELDKGIGERIAKKRIEKGLSQEELAARVNSSQGLIAKIETGNRKIQVDLLADIAEVLSTDCDYLLRGIPSKYLTAAESTGLSESALTKLREYNCGGSWGENIIEAIEALLSSKQGENILMEIYKYLEYDFSQFYITEVNENGDGFLPYDSPIGFKGRNGTSYWFLSSTYFEDAAVGNITESIKKMKIAYLNQLEEKQSRKIKNSKKKKMDSEKTDKEE